MEKVKRYPLVSGGLGLLVPGLGQVYNGKISHFMLFTLALFLFWAIDYFAGITLSFNGMLFSLIFIITLRLFSIILSVVTSMRERLQERKAYNRWYVYVLLVMVVCVASFTYSSFVIKEKSFYIPTDSMAPTILIGDRIHVDTGYRDIKRGDIIVFNPPVGETEKDYTKRCVAIGGDRFTIRNGSIYVNGEKKDEPYIKGKTGYQGFSDTTLIEGIVPADSYVVLGDNREHSLDSRYFGYVPRSRITGKVLYIWFAYDTKRIGTQL